MTPKKAPEKETKREQEDNGDELERSQRSGEAHTSSDDVYPSTSQQSQSAGIRRNLPLPMNLAVAVRALSSHTLPIWNAELWRSQNQRSNPVQGRPPVSQKKRVGSKLPSRMITARRQPTHCQIPLRPDLAQIKHLITQEITWRDGTPVRPTTFRQVTSQRTPGPSSLASGPHRTSAGPSDTSNASGSVVHSVRSLQLCSSSSDSSPSPTGTLPYRRTTPSFRTRRYRNQLEWYKTLRSEMKLRYHKKRLEQLYQKNRKLARGAKSSGAAQTDGPSGSQALRPVDQNVTSLQAGSEEKRKRSTRTEQALTEVSHIPNKRTRRSWRRQLDSSSSNSPSPVSQSATSDSRQPSPSPVSQSATSDSRQPVVPHAAPGPSGLKHCVDLNLFHNSSPTKTTPFKGIQGQRQSHNPAISSSAKAASTEVKTTRTNGVVGSPLTKTTSRKGAHSDRESQTPGITSSVKAKKSVVKPLKTTKVLCSEKESQTLTSSSSGTKATSNTEVQSSSTKAITKTPGKSSSSKEIKLKTKGASCISKSTVTPGAKPKTPKTKQNPLPDTPRPQRAKDPALLSKTPLQPRKGFTISTNESQVTSSSSSSSLQHPERQKKIIPVKKKDKSTSTSSHKKLSASATGANSVKNDQFKKPKPSSANVDSKNSLEKSKFVLETQVEGQVTQASNDEKRPHVEQIQIASNADKAQASDRPSTSSVQQVESSPDARGTPEHKKEPWSKKRYLLEKAAMDTAAQSPSHTPSRDTVVRPAPNLVSAVSLPHTDSISGSSGEATVSQTQISPFPATCPLTLSENTAPVPAPVLFAYQEPAYPWQCFVPKPEYRFLRQMQSKQKVGGSKRRGRFPKPDPPGLSCISLNSLAGISAASTSSTTSSSTSTTCSTTSSSSSSTSSTCSTTSSSSSSTSSTCSTTSSSSSSTSSSSSSSTSSTCSTTSSSSSSSSVAETRRSPAEIHGSQPSAETPGALLGAPSKGAPQGCPSCHGYAAGSAMTKTAMSLDSAPQGASDGHRPPPEGLLDQGPNERERDEEEHAANGAGGNSADVPAFVLQHQSGMRVDPGGQAHLSAPRVPMLASERRRVMNSIVRTVTSMLGIELRPAASLTVSPAGHQHQQPMLIHQPNMHPTSSPNQRPQMYYHLPAPPLPRQSPLLRGLRPPTTGAEQPPVLTPFHTMFSHPPAHLSEIPDGREHASDFNRFNVDMP
ncbi:serine/arginine repetitive matrix protein 2-like [Alosa sapidissima]|uniref:serine/arginine repetitive matrix protein 2-like n=1 Tax=Alosa sapidissima TaxID=34773 RepID=UPI001C093BD3|nr:serine/arginine repetitive matrix protein 2-like [Alosa sapidissima]